MFSPHLVGLYSRSQLENFKTKFNYRIESLTALVLAGKPRMDELRKVRADLDIVVEELNHRPLS